MVENMVKPLAYGFVILSVLAGCSDSNDDAAGAGGSAAGHDGGPSGTGGQHDASTETLSCSERESIASNAVVDALDGSELGCSTADDCEEISIDTECHAACGAVVATEHKAAVEAAIAAQDATTCADYESDGCARVIPPCDPPLGSLVCQSGRCTHGEPGACTEHVIRWGSDGGLVASRTLFVLEPCARFRAFTMTSGQPDATMICDNVVPEDHPITGAGIDALIAGEDVQNAIADAPVVLGIDARPVDGTLTRIEIDGAILDVGEPCDGADDCTEIPPGVRALATTLQNLVGQQHDVSPTCMNTT
jgi:hypothetical protein